MRRRPTPRSAAALALGTFALVGIGAGTAKGGHHGVGGRDRGAARGVRVGQGCGRPIDEGAMTGAIKVTAPSNLGNRTVQFR
jgi:hypothetical protein